MTPEEKAVRMMLLDCTQEQQEFYREEMHRLLETFKASYDINHEDYKNLYVAALAIAMSKFVEYVESNE